VEYKRFILVLYHAKNIFDTLVNNWHVVEYKLFILVLYHVGMRRAKRREAEDAACGVVPSMCWSLDVCISVWGVLKG